MQNRSRPLSPATGMGPPSGELRQQHGTTLSPVMGSPGSIHRRRRWCWTRHLTHRRPQVVATASGTSPPDGVSQQPAEAGGSLTLGVEASMASDSAFGAIVPTFGAERELPPASGAIPHLRSSWQILRGVRESARCRHRQRPLGRRGAVRTPRSPRQSRALSAAGSARRGRGGGVEELAARFSALRKSAVTSSSIIRWVASASARLFVVLTEVARPVRGETHRPDDLTHPELSHHPGRQFGGAGEVVRRPARDLAQDERLGCPAPQSNGEGILEVALR